MSLEIYTYSLNLILNLSHPTDCHDLSILEIKTSLKKQGQYIFILDYSWKGPVTVNKTNKKAQSEAIAVLGIIILFSKKYGILKNK